MLERTPRALVAPLIDRVAAHREEILAIAAQHRTRAPRIFGSVARGEDAPGSDLDVLVDFSDDASLLDEVGLRLALQDLLDVDVDLVSTSSLRGEVRDRVLGEAMPV